MSHSLQGSLDICVPQAVNEGVQHGVEKIVKQEKDLLLLLGVVALGGHVHDNGTAEEEPHTQRWEEQVEKAFLRPSPDWILRMAS